MEEHKMLIKFADELRDAVKDLKAAKGYGAVNEKRQHLNNIAKLFRDSESHYVREENVLFPYLEKHGVTHPPAIMWSEHNKIREIEKGLYGLIERQEHIAFVDFPWPLQQGALALAEMLSNHFSKENNILFPTALQVMEQGEWKDIRHQFDELGYCTFTPGSAIVAAEKAEAADAQPEIKGAVTFETGALSKEELEAIFDTLPVDVTFVDSNDVVRYFSQSKDRIFPRTKAVIGRKVQLCHPQQSVHVVERILSDFKSDKRDAASFWIDLKGRKVYIRYFAVRDKGGRYLGCLEVTQDITDIQGIKSEKRLLEY
jgi:PAS domain S-box-containing protein